MTEFIGLAYFAEIPVTIVDVQRGGPSTGMPTRTQQADLLACAYAGHGDTKHPLLFPEDPAECFEFAAQALDLADRLQTPIFLMTDLDIGMNHRLAKPLKWDDARAYDRGKVMTEAELEAGKDFGRYLDVDGDGIPYRTLPGTHPKRGAYFTRGTTKNAYASYSEAGPDYVYNVQRLLKKFETAKTLVPKPVLTPAKEPARFGAIYFGSTSPSMHEALESLAEKGIFINALRVRAFPFQDEIFDFVQSHSKVFVIEQNRDAQMKTLLVNDAGINPASLISILHYDGTPITARFITKEIARDRRRAQRAADQEGQGGVRAIVFAFALVNKHRSFCCRRRSPLGKAEGYPVCKLQGPTEERCLVGMLSHFDEIAPARTVKAGVPRALKRADHEPQFAYSFRGQPRTLDGFLAASRDTGLLVMQGDTILVERYQYDRKPEMRFQSYSMAKTVVAMLVGIAISDKKIQFNRRQGRDSTSPR